MTKEERIKRNYEIICLSEKLSQKEIGKIFNLTQTNIGKILRSYGIKLKKSRLNMSKLNLDVDYFKLIDTPKKAYWLGFITADGGINKNNSKLSICTADLEVLEKLKKDIQSGHKISEIHNFDKRTNKTYHEYSIQITNELFVNNIVKWGITNNKTNVCIFPEINEELYSYFIAGLFDGDGSVSCHKNELRCNLISTKEILDFIDDLLLKKFEIIPCKKNKVTENKSNVYKQYWYKNSKKFLDYIYQGDSEIYLSRKYNKYKKHEQK